MIIGNYGGPLQAFANLILYARAISGIYYNNTTPLFFLCSFHEFDDNMHCGIVYTYAEQEIPGSADIVISLYVCVRMHLHIHYSHTRANNEDSYKMLGFMMVIP